MSEKGILKVGRQGSEKSLRRDYHVRILAIDSSVCKKMLQIDGVIAVGAKSYSMSVKRAPMYEWDEIEPEILETLARGLGVQTEVVDLPNPEDELVNLLEGLTEIIEAKMTAEKTAEQPVEEETA